MIQRLQHPIDVRRQYRKSGEVVPLPFPRIAFLTVSYGYWWRRHILRLPGVSTRPSGRDTGMDGSFMVRALATRLYNFDTQGLPLT